MSSSSSIQLSRNSRKLSRIWTRSFESTPRKAKAFSSTHILLVTVLQMFGSTFCWTLQIQQRYSIRSKSSWDSDHSKGTASATSSPFMTFAGARHTKSRSLQKNTRSRGILKGKRSLKSKRGSLPRKKQEEEMIIPPKCRWNRMSSWFTAQYQTKLLLLTLICVKTSSNILLRNLRIVEVRSSFQTVLTISSAMTG